MCSQKCARPLIERGSDEAPTSTIHDMAVVLLSLSCMTRHVTPFSNINPRYSLQSAFPLTGPGNDPLIAILSLSLSLSLSLH